jgi:hypothetical protein
VTRLHVVGIGDPAAEAAVEIALLACDPQARIEADWATGLVDIASPAAPDALCAALLDAGFIAAPVKSGRPRIRFRDLVKLAARALLFALLASVGGAIAGLIAGVANVVWNSECHSGGDEGACAMGIPLIAIGFAGIAALAAAAVTLARGAFRLHRHGSLRRVRADC